VNLGYDEVLTWPLVSTPTDSKTVITTQNSINTEVIYLRQSLIPSLQEQLDQYQRLKLNATQFFEIGKVFHQHNNQYIEWFSLGIYNVDQKALLRDAMSITGEEYINLHGNFVEIILRELQPITHYTSKVENYHAYELTSQIITLDANITLTKQEDPLKLIKKYSQIIGPTILWEMVITDIYHDTKTNKYRYTFRVFYFNTDDKTAKETHLKAFDLK
jgi:phenylalanyl-tRNA synthetase beta subunit